MQRDVIVKGRSLGGSSDLTLLAPIKPGFIDSLESVTYKTRIKRVLEVLHGTRAAAYEYATAQLLSDSVERVGVIHSVRVAVLEPQDNVLLAVTFDGSWESYIRVLWDKVGALLDLIFCGTVGYVTASEHSFDEWHAWARSVQVESGFFFGPPSFTARDARYLRRTERMRVCGDGGASTRLRELHEMRAVELSAEAAVERFVANQREPLPDDPPYKRLEDTRMVRERVRHGFQGLAALYRLVDLHRPGTAEGEVLRRAAIDLLREFVGMRDSGLIGEQLKEERVRFARQLDWLFPDGPALRPRADAPARADTAVLPEAALSGIQGGIIATYDKVTHGLLLFLTFQKAQQAADFLGWVEPRLTRASDPHDASGGAVFRNLALTPAGLRTAGLDEDVLELFPEEFRQGMAARAGLLGDVRNNHPRRWRLPRRYRGSRAQEGLPIDLESVHAVFQLRCGVLPATPASSAVSLRDAKHPLRAEVTALRQELPDVQILAVQSMRRNLILVDGKEVVREHFHYADGSSQPELAIENRPVASPPFDLNRIHPGELLIGRDNAADRAPNLSDPKLRDAERLRLHWMRDGTFLVVRKYRQYVARLAAAVGATAAEMARVLRGKENYEEIVYAKLMGRSRDGRPIVHAKSGTLNNFRYDDDPQGVSCPLRAHIRRAHPRLPVGAMARPPRLVRRGMSYGPPAASGDTDAIDRGLVFMAYNASIGEQFEVVQRWLSGGNSTGVSSAESCPIVGVPENGLSRHFRFEHKGRVFRVELESDIKLFEEPPMPTRLEWGAYLFAPSIAALQALRTQAATAAAVAPRASEPWSLESGRATLAALRSLEEDAGATAAALAWKAAIEDPESIDRLQSAAMWAAIRSDHGGVLQTPYGTLVASRELVAEVFMDPDSYSVCGQLERMKRSFGEISLGMDAGRVYDQQSDPINAAIGRLTEADSFDITFAAATNKIDAIVSEAKTQAMRALDARFEVGCDIREVMDAVMVALCNDWFGLDDDPNGRFRPGGTDWAWQEGQPPLYPGHFTALSRYMFQPHPGTTAEDLGQRYGKALRQAMTLFVADHRSRHDLPGQRGAASARAAPIAKAIFDHPDFGRDNDFVARNMVGVLMGFNPTIIGAVINVVREWQRDGTFGALRAELNGRRDFAAATDVLAAPMAAAMRMRPMPQIGWRTVRTAHRIGTGPHAVDVDSGDLIVLAVVSATQQSAADGCPDGRLMFGGIRRTGHPPTHACPGYAAAIGAMLGALAAILTRTEELRRGAAPLSFVLEGLSMLTPQSPGPRAPPVRLTSIAGRKGVVLAWGDSWLDFRSADPRFVGDAGQDLRDWLQEFGYQVPTDFCSWTSWPMSSTMADNPSKFRRFLREHLQIRDKPPLAILLSAGGNDSTQAMLAALLNRKATGVDVIDKTALATHIGRIGANYRTVLRALASEFTDSNISAIPVLLHGYDYPFPQGKHGLVKWLAEPFSDKGYLWSADHEVMTTTMKTLIDELNREIASLPAEFGFARYVDLRNTIAAHWAPDPGEGWDNDLHPTSQAFELLAEKIDAQLQALVRKRRRSGPTTAVSSATTSA